MATQRMPYRKYAYFRDDQITFLITHPEVEITEDQLNNLSGRIKEFLGGATISWPLSQRFSFPRPTGSELEQQAAILSDLQEYLKEQKREYIPSDYESELFKDEQDQSKLGFSIVVGNTNTGLEPKEFIGLIRRLRESMKGL